MLYLLNHLLVQTKEKHFSLSLVISISVGFYILVFLLDELVIEVDLDLFIELSVSGLFFWEVGTVFLCYFFICFVKCVSIIFF